jgi:hypothetical protein
LDYIERKGIHLLGDGGYFAGNIFSPKDSISEEEKKIQIFLRGIVEIVFGIVHVWKAATDRFRESSGTQALVLGIIYELVQLTLQNHPIRPYLLDLNSNQDLPSPCLPIGSAEEVKLLHSLLDKDK